MPILRSRRYAAAATLTAMVLALAACGGDDGSGGGEASGDSAAGGELQTVRLAVAAATGFLPFYVGQQEGIFEEHGIDLQITLGTDFPAWQAALGSQYDVVGSGAGLYMSSVSKGLDNVVISGGNLASRERVEGTSGPIDLITTEDIGDDLTQLRGKRIGVTGTASDGYAMPAYALKQAGVEPDDVEWVTTQGASMVDNLKAGNIDAAVTNEPFTTAAVEAGFFRYPYDITAEAHYLATDGERDVTSGLVYAANATWVEENPDLAGAVVDAEDESIEWIKEHPEEARAHLGRMDRDPGRGRRRRPCSPTGARTSRRIG